MAVPHVERVVMHVDRLSRYNAKESLLKNIGPNNIFKKNNFQYVDQTNGIVYVDCSVAYRKMMRPSVSHIS